MRCPDCGYDNVPGADDCQECGVSLVAFDPQGNEVEQSLTAHPISVLCPREPICLAPETPVREVLRRMSEQNQGCVLITAGRALLGVFSERDALNKVMIAAERLDLPVSEFMTRSPTTVTLRDSLGFALQAMDLGGYRHLPVVDLHGMPVGLVSSRDVLRFVCVKYAASRG